MNGIITIDELAVLCRYGTHINIKRADNGKIVINGVNAMKFSKDKRQQAKWEAFRYKPVYGISPSVEIEGCKRSEDVIRLDINAWIGSGDCEQAVAEYKASVDHD